METDGNRTNRPFRIKSPFRSPGGQRVWAFLDRPLHCVTGLDALNRVYERAAAGGGAEGFVERVLRDLRVHCSVSDLELERIPASGPTVVVSNHPFGGIEGLLLASALRAVRPDVKLMANYLLSPMPEMRDLFFFVDPFGTHASTGSNIAALKDAIRWLSGGGMLAVFPAGEVAHFDIRQRRVIDPGWTTNIARLIRKAQPAVLPVFFEGRNSLFFQAAGFIHPLVRTALLPHELLKMRGRGIRLRVGGAIPYRKLKGFESDSDLINYLRLRTYNLRNRKGVKGPDGEDDGEAVMPPVVPADDSALLTEELYRLPPECILLDSGDFLVVHARSYQMPLLLREIARLREVTFRLVGEGTGSSIDMDEFDKDYIHLFVWHKEKAEIAGAYRIGLTDEIVRRSGKHGLYTSTLFRYGSRLLRRMGSAAELGRSFVCPEYQRNHAVLMMLWKGIGQFVVRNPTYRILFGAVSISNEYDTISRQLMVQFLRHNDYLSDLARLVRPRTPVRRPGIRRLRRGDMRVIRALVSDIDEVSAMVSDIERDQKGVPMLLRHYLRLGGKMLGFNRDPAFRDVVDGLVMVDLVHTDCRILDRYLSPEGAKSFLAYHEHAQETISP